MTDIVWARDFSPECLWIASLTDIVGLEYLHKPYYALMDVMDSVWPHTKDIALGMISDFGEVPTTARLGFFETNSLLVDELFGSTVASILSLYPESPAAWLTEMCQSKDRERVDPARELPRLRRLLSEMQDGTGPLATTIKALLFGRLVKHRKLQFPRNLPIVDLVPRYPQECTVEERLLVESFIRSTTSAFLPLREIGRDRDWSRYFWRHNLDLTVCIPRLLELRGSVSLEPDSAQSIYAKLIENSNLVIEYVDLLQNRLKIDLYDPTRDEILAGLFARAARLYVLFATTPILWARDIGGILLRCMAETAITFCYLAVKGSGTEFELFRKHGEGQEKLLMLHLQDNHPTGQTVEGRSGNDLLNDFGRFGAELISIELGHWTKKDARKLATEVGMEDLYRLVFTPTSNDVHGSWASLKHANLVLCAEPMHRLHRVPTYTEPPMYVNVIQTAQSLFLKCYEIAVGHLGYEQMRGRLTDIQSTDDNPTNDNPRPQNEP